MIRELLNRNESKTLEFKENVLSLQSIMKTIVAFANTSGGIIVIGIEDKTKKIVGLHNPLADEERLTNAIHDSIAPHLMPDIEIHAYRKKELIVIHVPHVAGPFYLKSAGLEKGTYIRLGSTNRIVNDEMLHALKDYSRNIVYDETAHTQSHPDDLDWNIIEDLFKRAGKKVTYNSAHSIGLLTTLGNKEYPSQGAVILFGINRLKKFPDAIIRCVRFIGNNKEILDRLDIETYLPLAIEEALLFIRRNTRMRGVLEEWNLARKDIPEYPPIALREALINAVVHADYTMKGSSISIAIFDDRIEITNPGILPFGFTLERALAGSSRIRNRVIAKVFHHLQWIEQWGVGISRIFQECASLGLKEPLFQELDDRFRVTLYAASEKMSSLPKQ
jgi:predicted HTH transcriptional regulator